MPGYPDPAGGAYIPPASNFEKLLNGPQSMDEKAADANDRGAHAFIRWTLNRMGLSSYARRMEKSSKNQGGPGMLTCEVFNDTFHNFPFFLGFHSLKRLTVPWAPMIDGVRANERRTAVDYQVHMDDHSIELERYKNFDKVPFVVAYKDLYSRCTRSKGLRHVALIYPRKGCMPEQGGMCIHDDETERFWAEGFGQVYKFTNGTRLYIQPFPAIVDAIVASGWRPDNS